MMSIVTSLYAQALAWSLVHFLWQGAVLGLAAFVCLRFARLSPDARHFVGVVTLAAMVAAPAATFGWIVRSVSSKSDASGAPPPLARAPSLEDSVGARAAGAAAFALTAITAAVSPAAPAAPRSTNQDGQNPLLILVLLSWLTGVASLSVRLFGGWVVARRFAHRATWPVTPDIHALARRIAGRLAVERAVQVFQSTAIAVPIMVGWLKPVILLPAAALHGLTPDQVEALLAHELAHVRRGDYLVNLLQSAVETLLFYHPAVWWVSDQVRAEREHCCDDLAISVCGDRVVYAAALADLAAMTTPRLALAASDGSLVARVRRILAGPSHRSGAPAGWTPALFALLLLCGALVPLLANSEKRRASDLSLADSPSLIGLPSTLNPNDAPLADLVRHPVAPANDSPEFRAQATEREAAPDQEPTASQLRGQLDEAKKALAELQRRLEEISGGNASTREEIATRKAMTEEDEKSLLDRERLLKQKLEAARLSEDKSQAADLKAQQMRQEVEELRQQLEFKAEQARQDDLAKSDQAREESTLKSDRERQTLANELVVRKMLEEARRDLESQRERYTDQSPELLKKISAVRALQEKLATLDGQVAERKANATMIYMAARVPLEIGNVITVELRGDNGRMSLPDITIAADGTLKLPWVGTVKVNGLTLQQCEETLLKSLATHPDLLDGKPVKAVVVTVERKEE
jgi:beta-lactamase regulating signal transducer with metallopeptidase domain